MKHFCSSFNNIYYITRTIKICFWMVPVIVLIIYTTKFMSKSRNKE